MIAASGAPLKTLRLLAQNLPAYATALARRVVVRDAVTAELLENQAKVQGGLNAVWLNGVMFEGEATPFSCVYSFHAVCMCTRWLTARAGCCA